ncbi:MAG: DUF3592 domain-containing protein [Myxococcales bacterium]|nr:DUF3592 domain-containing protein [Myxococcales bacterium]
MSVFRTAPPEAPPAPRALSADLASHGLAHGRFLRLFGAIWASIGLGLGAVFAVVALASGLAASAWLAASAPWFFAVAGSLLWLVGRAQRARALHAYRDGVEAQGRVVDVYLDRRVRMNGQHPWRVVYEFMVGGQPRRGKATYWDDEPPHVAKGARVVVLHPPGRPGQSVLWTRFEDDAPNARPVEPTRTGVRIATDAGADLRPAEVADAEGAVEIDAAERGASTRM